MALATTEQLNQRSIVAWYRKIEDMDIVKAFAWLSKAEPDVVF